jgi:hypothetical protein
MNQNQGPIAGGKRIAIFAAFLGTFVSGTVSALADEGGVSFWLPGLFGSLAAAPQQPGWSFANVYYHTSVSGGGEVAAERQLELGAFSRTANVSLNARVNSGVDVDLVTASYVFASPVLGGQLAVGMFGMAGHNNTSIDGTLTASVGSLTATRTGSIGDERSGVGDLYPQASLRWNSGVNNYMMYLTGDLPVGLYNSSNLANFGIGHGAIDGGVGYTYFNPQTGHEFSVVTGLTGNLINTSTNYQNGIDWHLDWGASQFLTKQWQIGAVGYVYKQITADTGALPILEPFESRVVGVGPQIGYIFPVGNLQGYLNAKAYFEFDSHDRASGWNTWLTFAISPAAPPAPTSPAPRGSMIFK